MAIMFDVVYKGQKKSEWIYEVIDFPNCNSKIWRISALKVYFKLNQKVVLITLCTHGKPSLNMQISRDIQLQNFQGRNPSNFLVANLENWWLHKFILTLSDH